MKKLWTKFRRWYLRVFFGIYTVVKPSGTVSILTENTDGYHPPLKLQITRNIKFTP